MKNTFDTNMQNNNFVSIRHRHEKFQLCVDREICPSERERFHPSRGRANFRKLPRKKKQKRKPSSCQADKKRYPKRKRKKGAAPLTEAPFSDGPSRQRLEKKAIVMRM